MIKINETLSIRQEEVEWQAVRSQGAGGQNVNKVSSAVHLRFDIRQSTLPDDVKHTLLSLSDKRISKEGVIVIKAQQFRRQDKNHADALARLASLIQEAAKVRKRRKPTRPSKRAVRKRLDSKSRRSQLKTSRGKVDFD